MSTRPWITVFMIIGGLSLGEFAANQNAEIAEILHRSIRSLTYPDTAVMGFYMAYSVPLADPRHAVSLSQYIASEYGLPSNFTDDLFYYGKRKRRGINRGTVYRALESKFNSAGYPGRECLLRSICETSEWPIRHNGILGDVMHVILTPSTSRSEDLPEEYAEAERTGRDGTCSKSYSLCPMGIFDIIETLVGA